MDLNAKTPSTTVPVVLSSSSFEESTWIENAPSKPFISTDEKESPMLCGKDVNVPILGNFYEKSYIIIKGIRFEVIETADSKGKRIYKCCSCNTEVSSPITHALVHNEERPYKCEYSGCFKSYKGKEALKRHIGSNHTPGSYGCPKCGKIYKTQHLLQKHLSVVCQNQVRPYICEICQKTFKTRTSLAYHMGIHSSVKKFPCEVCKKAFPSKLHLHNHQLTHKTGCYKCFCGLQYKNVKSYKEHVKLIHDKTNPRKCSVCLRNFKNDKALENHKKSHLKPFTCKVCKKGFNTASNCYMHEKLRHGSLHQGFKMTSDWSCPTCPKTCKTYRALYAHMRIHNVTDEHQFECNICHLTFTQKQTMNDHIKSHSAAGWGCQKCNKTFPSQGALKYHEKHHSKPYPCKFCGARFSLSGFLKNHQKKCKHLKDSVFTCAFCNLKFFLEVELEMHMLNMHPGEKLIHLDCSSEIPGKSSSVFPCGIFNCEVCEYVFKTEKSLLQHELKMHALKSSRQNCTVCNVKFTTSRTLNKHRFLEHNIGRVKKCDHCLREFYTLDGLSCHLLRVHKSKEFINSGSMSETQSHNSEVFQSETGISSEITETASRRNPSFKSLLSTFQKF